MNPQIDAFIEKSDKWQKEMLKLREILLECGLTEELKWKQPCYTFNGANILIIANFKSFVALSFFKGVLMRDSEGVLEKLGANSQSVRSVKFTAVQEIIHAKAFIKSYIFEAIEIEKSGLKAEKKESKKLNFPEELFQLFEENSEFKAAFEALTPSRQRGYNLFFSAAKQSATRISRIEKYKDRIFNGKGINDCVCGLSKRMPNCDGSHNLLKK